MPHLIIDHLAIEVPKGTKVIEAAAQLGIIIPRFCFHPALGSLGACRLCAVKFMDGPIKGIEMSCMQQARDGMVVSTTDEEVVEFRRQIIEWLMMNHPHDCPVCDAGGHCLLQDLTVAGGQGTRRFLGKKRTYKDQDLGIFIQHEMNRCIHCFRCRRFYQDLAGYRDFGALQIAGRMYFGRFQDGPLESPFSGNLIDLCPTGVLTDKPSRFQGRRWDFQRSPSLCIHCSLGCRVIASARYREVVRLEAGFSEPVNGYFICDRGRYGFYYSHHMKRPRRAMVDQQETSPDEALGLAADSLSQIAHQFGKGAIHCQGSFRSPLETLGALKMLCQGQGWPEPGYLIDPQGQGALQRAVSRLTEPLAVSMREIEQADFILVIGADPNHEAPMLALAIRQAFRKGAKVTVMDPRPIFLPLTFEPLFISPQDLDLGLEVLLKRAVSPRTVEKIGPPAWEFYQALADAYPGDPALDRRLKELSENLKQSRHPIIVCGTGIVRATTPDRAADLVFLLQAQGQPAGLFFLLPGANAFGAALLSSPENTFLKTLEAIEEGSIAALVLVEADPFRHFPDRFRLEQALEKLSFLLVMDYLPSLSVRRADIFCPTQTLFEAGGHFINQEGRMQQASPVYGGGIPMAQISHGDHPPRLFRQDIPEGEPRPAWQLLLELGRRLSPGSSLSLETLWEGLTRGNPLFSRLTEGPALKEPIRLVPRSVGEPAFSFQDREDQPSRDPGPDTLELLLVDQTFGTEELSSYSGPIQEVQEKPGLLLSKSLGARLGLNKGDQAVLSLDRGPLQVEVTLGHPMAEGVLLLPRHPELDWQKITTFPIVLPLDGLKKIQEAP